jgi:hypothetical protein
MITRILVAFAAVSIVLASPAGITFAQVEKAEEPVEATPAPSKEPVEQKKPGVFELVSKLLEIKIQIKGKKISREQADDISGKVDGALRDCFVQQIKANEKYRVRDDRLYRSKYALGVRMEQGLFKKVAVTSSSGTSPIVKACIKPLTGFETGYGELTGQAAVEIETRLR